MARNKIKKHGPTKTLSVSRKRAMKRHLKNREKHESEKLRRLPEKIADDKVRANRHAEHLKACAAKALKKAELLELKAASV